jgi:hypothetical protein
MMSATEPCHVALGAYNLGAVFSILVFGFVLMFV